MTAPVYFPLSVTALDLCFLGCVLKSTSDFRSAVVDAMEEDPSDMSSNPEPSSASINAIHNSFLDNELLNSDTAALNTALCDSKNFTKAAQLEMEPTEVCTIFNADGENSSPNQSNTVACDSPSAETNAHLVPVPPVAASASEFSSTNQLTTQEDLLHELKNSPDLSSDIKDVCLSDAKEICSLPIDSVCNNDDKISGYQLPACEKSLDSTIQMPLSMNRRCSSELALGTMNNCDAMLDISNDDKDLKVVQEQLGEEGSVSGIAADKDDSEFEGSSDLDYMSNEEGDGEEDEEDEDDDADDDDIKKANLMEDCSEKSSGNGEGVSEVVDLKYENVSKSPGECDKSVNGN